ncbi:MAG: T9SS type A sorting domain-containing protein [Bacteroidota bacterium]
MKIHSDQPFKKALMPVNLMGQTSPSPKKRNHSLLSSLLTGVILISSLSSVTAENVITSGTTFTIMPGTKVVSSENLVIKSGATLDNAGTVILKKGLSNENAAPNSIGAGTAEFSGSVNQTISGKNIIRNTTVSNATGVTLAGNTIINGTLTLTTGTVTLGSNNLQLGPAATIAGTPSSTVMIIVTGTGELRKEFASGFTGNFTFPVGDNSGTAEYSPVTLTFSDGTFSSGNYVGITLVNSIYPDGGITGNYLNRYWTLTQSGITGFTCNAAFQYVVADVTGTENKISCTRVNPLPWVTYALTNSGTHVLSANGITSFSSFTGVKSTTPPVNQELVNITIPNGTSTCYDATQVLTVAGTGKTFIVENNGSVTLVAGNKITVLPGARIYPGGYLHAYITTTGTYCGSMFNPLVENPEKEFLSMDENQKNQWIRIYPNPSSDFIIIELDQSATSAVASVSIYNMNGKPILQQTMNGENKKQFSLSGLPVGLYMVYVRSAERAEIAKIIRN